MTKAHQAITSAEPDPIGIDGVLSSARTYISERFPVSQAGAVLSAYICCYLLYGQARGDQVFQWPTVVGGITVVLLALVRRILDDAEDLREDLDAGRFSADDGGRHRLRGLVAGGVVTATVVALLNASCSIGLLATSVGVAAWFLVAVLLRGKTALAKSRLWEYAVVETCPAVLLLYSYPVWVQASGDSVPTFGVVAAVGLFWTVFQFWSFTRKIGTDAWAPWGLSVRATLPALIGFLVLTAGFGVLTDHYAHLPTGYVVYAFGLPCAVLVLVLRRWAQLPARDLKRTGAVWAGMPFGVAVEGGVLIAVLVAAL